MRKLTIILIVSVVVCFGAFLFAYGQTTTDQEVITYKYCRLTTKPTLQKSDDWYYSVSYGYGSKESTMNTSDQMTLVNNLGKGGWELVSVSTVGTEVNFYFRKGQIVKK